MHIVALFGGHNPNGLTAQLARHLLAKADGSFEFIDLNTYDLHPNQPHQDNPKLDALEAKLADADVWLLVSPTYYGSVAGPLKQALDCLRPRIIRMTARGDSLPGKYRGKVYLSLSSCFASGFDNTFTHQTDACLTTLDKAMSTAGLRKAGELVLLGTWGMKQVPSAKLKAAERLAAKLPQHVRKDDEAMKRYGLLFVMVAVMALLTMSLQLLLPIEGFWLHYLSFVIIFFGLLAGILHYATFMRHKHR